MTQIPNGIANGDRLFENEEESPSKFTSVRKGLRIGRYVEQGYDAGKKVSGIKRHIACGRHQQTAARYHRHEGRVMNRNGALARIRPLHRRPAQVASVLVEGGYSGAPFAEAVQQKLGARVEIAKRSELHTFVVLPRRWVVELSFAWLEKCIVLLLRRS